MQRTRLARRSRTFHGLGFFVLITASLLYAPTGLVGAQTPGECVPENGPVITCTGLVDELSIHRVDVPPDAFPNAPKSWRLVVIGRQAEAINEGTLEARGVLPAGAVLVGEANRLHNMSGAWIDSESDRTNLPAFGVWLINTRASVGGVVNLENHGNIVARGGGGWGAGVSAGETPPENRFPIPPNEVWYTSGVLLLGHNIEALNTGTIRAEQLGSGTGEHDRVIGVSSYWAFLGERPGEPSPNRITNQGNIEAEGYKAAGVLLRSDPEQTLANDEVYQYYLFNEGGTIAASGGIEAVGVHIIGGLTSMQNTGVIDAQTNDSESFESVAVGIHARGSNLEIRNEGEDSAVFASGGMITVGMFVGEPSLGGDSAGDSDLAVMNSGSVEAESSGFASGVSIVGSQRISLTNSGSLSARAPVSAFGAQVFGDDANVTNTGSIAAEAAHSVGGLGAEGANVQIANSGLIEARIGEGSATSSLAFGVWLSGQAGGVANEGEIVAAGASEAVGVWLVGKDLAFRNEGTVSASGENAWALRVQGDHGNGFSALLEEGEADAVNAHTLTAQGTNAVGVELDVDNFNFVNDTDATISAVGDSALGVWVKASGVAVVNSGTIEAVRRQPEVAAAEEGDPVPALPRVAAIALDGESGEVDNKGTVRALGDEAIGIDVQGADNVVHNAGLVEVDGSGAVGVRVVGRNGELVNEKSGRIVATGEDSIGVALAWNPDSADTPLNNSGRISGEGTGVFVLVDGDQTDSSLENAGQISGATGVDIAFTSGGGNAIVKLVNDGRGVIAGEDGPAVRSSDITGDGSGTGGVELENRGEIKGDIELLSGGDDTVRILGGEVDGHIKLGGGQDELTIVASALVQGTVDGGGAGEDNRLVLQGANKGQLLGVQNFRFIDIDDSEEGQWEFGELSLGAEQEQQVDVSGSVTVGVLWLAPGSVLSVSDGLVIDNVSIHGEHERQGFLAGMGTIQGDVLLQGGFLSPGEDEGDIGTLTIAGNYVQGSKATFIVDVRPREEGEEYGQSDRLRIPDGAGTAFFEEGSTILVRVARGKYDGETTYLILDGELDGAMLDAEHFQSLNVVTDSPFLFGTLKAGSLVLVLEKDFSRAGRTPNQKEVGRALSKAPGGAFEHIEEALMGLTSPAAARDALDQLSGEIYTSYLGVSEVTLGQFTRLIGRGMDVPVPMEDNKIWADLYTHFSTVQSTRQTARAELEQTGVVFGIARQTSERGRIGFLGGVNRSRVNMPARRNKSTGDGFQLGAYGRYRGETGSLTGILAFSEGRHDVERNIRFGEYRATPEGRVNARALGATVEGRLHYTVSGFEVEPLLGLTWMDLTQDSVNERSGGEANLRISKAEADLLRATAGVRIGTQPAGTGVWPEFMLAWVRDFDDIPSEVEARFAAYPDGPFRVEGTQAGRSALVAGLSIEGVRESGTTWQLGYRGEYRDKRSAHMAMLSFHFPF